MIRGAIFDLDGTLGDTLPVCFQAFRSVLAPRLGRSLADGEIHAMFGPSEEGILARLVPEDADAAVREYLDAYRLAHSGCMEPFPGVQETLELLQRWGVDLAIVTGKGPGSARISLEVLGLDSLFPLVEAGSPAGGVKPAAMRRVLDRWGHSPSSVIGVGDSPSDVRSAREVRICSVAAAWAPGSHAGRLAACQPDWLFREVAALRGWLEGSRAMLKE